MIQQDNVISHLTELAKLPQRGVIGRLNVNDLVNKSSGLSYSIDDLGISRVLGNFPLDALPYGPVYRSFRNPKQDILGLFGKDTNIPFSRAVESSVGECLEKATLLQLAVQDNMPSFLVNGAMSEGDSLDGYHAFNVVFSSGKPFLVDVQNPLRKEEAGKPIRPFVAPILGIEHDWFELPENWRHGRAYYLS